MFPPVKLPWQYTFEQVAPFQAGLAPPVPAMVPKVTSTTPLAWEVLEGTTWHSAQERALPSLRWRAWAPTARVVVAVSPFEPLGGAAEKRGFSVVSVRVESPWQEEQVRFATSTLPSTWVARLTVVAV